MSEPNAPAAVREHRRKRIKIDVACDTCRARKVKCDGARPVCGNCLKKPTTRDTCKYGQNGLEKTTKRLEGPIISSRGPPLRVTHDRDRGSPLTRTENDSQQRLLLPRLTSSQARSVTSPRIIAESELAANNASPTADRDAAPSVIDSMTAVIEEGINTDQYFGSSSAGSFTKQIKAAIDARLGRSRSPKVSYMNTITTSPNSSFPKTIRVSESPDYVLPPRRQADNLMDVYWFYVDPLYPFLDRDQWDKSYHDLFSGASIGADERVFVTTLNIILALSTQLLESLRPEKRDESSNSYFQRAQELLHLSIWASGSTELVQCLLLMSQYLQSTNNPHQTWMVVGSAIRTAQSLGLHLPETSANAPSPQKRELLRRLWHGCVLMDRMVSVTHGRPSMITNRVALAVPLPFYLPDPVQDSDWVGNNSLAKTAFFVKSVELYEIIHLTLLAFYSSNNTRLVDKHYDDDVNTMSDENSLDSVMRLDDSLVDWELTLPSYLKFGAFSEGRNEVNQRQVVILHIRFLQARILLLRPTLFKFCLEHEPPGLSQLPERLRDRIAQQCASLCATVAQSMISVLATFQRQDGTVGLLPAWWYRVYYVYSAATILIVAKLRPDVFPLADINKSLGEAMTVLEAHEQFGQSPRRCLAALNILSSQILQGVQGSGAQRVSGSTMADGLQPNADTTQPVPQPFEDFTMFPDLNLPGLTFDANDLSFLNMHAWELLNEP